MLCLSPPHKHMRTHTDTHQRTGSVRGPHVCQSFIQTQLRLLHATIITRWTRGKHIRSAFSLTHCTPSCETKKEGGEKNQKVCFNDFKWCTNYYLSLNSPSFPFNLLLHILRSFQTFVSSLLKKNIFFVFLWF